MHEVIDEAVPVVGVIRPGAYYEEVCDLPQERGIPRIACHRYNDRPQVAWHVADDHAASIMPVNSFAIAVKLEEAEAKFLPERSLVICQRTVPLLDSEATESILALSRWQPGQTIAFDLFRERSAKAEEEDRAADKAQVTERVERRKTLGLPPLPVPPAPTEYTPRYLVVGAYRRFA